MVFEKFGLVTNTPPTVEIPSCGGVSGAITMVVRNPRRLQLVIINEGLIDLHKLHRFQTNLLYPVHLDYSPSDRGANKQGECANAGQKFLHDDDAVWKSFFIRDQSAPSLGSSPDTKSSL